MQTGKVPAPADPAEYRCELEELQQLLERAERGNSPDDHCAAILFRDLIRRRRDR